jgi:hypothetical protein
VDIWFLPSTQTIPFIKWAGNKPTLAMSQNIGWFTLNFLEGLSGRARQFTTSMGTKQTTELRIFNSATDIMGRAIGLFVILVALTISIFSLYNQKIATLSTTLSSASSNRASTGSSSYPVPKVSNPYNRMGAQTNFGSGGSGQQGLYAGLLQSGQFQRPQVSTEFQTQYNFDPVLAKLSALGEMSIANARTEAANAKKQALIDAGALDIAKETGADENTLGAIGQNNIAGLSTQAKLMKEYQDRQRQMDEQLNASNLFYSGERIRQHQDLEQGRLSAESQFGGNLRGLLSSINAQLQAAEEAELMRQIEAQIAAAGSGYTGPIGGGGVAPPGAAPLAPPNVSPQTPWDAGSYANYTPSQPVGMESPGAMYIPSLGFRAPVYEDPNPLAALLQGRYTNPVAY